MCIVLLTTAHPSYALIVIDNRDEFILRPTSRPHWWTPDPAPGPSDHPHGPSHPPPPPQPQVLSSRDLQRRERGTWLGISRAGNFAVLTNYREAAGAPAGAAARSRGAMVTAWLAAPPAEATGHFVERMLAGDGVGGVGGFSLICGKLRRRRRRRRSSRPRTETPAVDAAAAAAAAGPQQQQQQEQKECDSIAPLAVLSNRASHPSHVPWIAGSRGETLGLSNTRYDDDDGEPWRKIVDGKAAVERVVAAAVAAAAAGEDRTEAQLLEELFAVLDADTLPVAQGGESFEACTQLLKYSIFIPAIGDAEHRAAMAEAAGGGGAGPQGSEAAVPEELAHEERPDGQAEGPSGFATGMYGTQRQTVMLVDWDGNVTYVERALWDDRGRPVKRGQGDVCFRFNIEGWEDGDDDADVDVDG